MLSSCRRNHIGERKDFSDLIGKIEGIPIFEKKVNQDSGEVEYSGYIHYHKTMYTIPFTDETLDKLVPYFTDNVSFAIKGQGLATRTYSCSFEEMRDLEWDDPVKLKTDWTKSDYYRVKQLAAQGGVKR
jgi:hypothetical protein